MAGDEVHEGASVKEQLIEACRRNNVDLLTEIIEGCSSEEEITKLMNETTTVMGNHLYHEAASRGNYEIIDLLLDQPNFECDPINRVEGDTPLHTAIRWINSEPEAQRPFGNSLVDMMLEAGSNPRVKNKGRLTPYDLVDPRNAELRQLIQRHEYLSLNQGDFINADEEKTGAPTAAGGKRVHVQAQESDGDDDDAEFSGSDEEERAEWERRRRDRRGRKG